MTKIQFFTFILVFAVLNMKAQTDIVLADYEVESIYPDRTSELVAGHLNKSVDNPLIDGTNGSPKVASCNYAQQWWDGIIVNNFDEPISLGVYPFVKIKILSDTATSRWVSVILKDINDYEKSVNFQLPGTALTEWTDAVFDFSDIAQNSPISFIKEMRIAVDLGNPSGIYYFDDIRFTGPSLTISSSDTLAIFNETFSDNGWWGPGGGTPKDSTIAYFRVAQWGGSALSAPEKHYNLDDSLSMAMDGWSGQTMAYFYPSSSKPYYSSLTIKNIAISGFQNIDISYDLNWKTAPSSFTSSPTVEYSLNGTSWNTVTTSSTLPSSGDTWAIGLSYPLTGVIGDTLMVRITNNTDGNYMIDNLTVNANPALVTSIDVETQDSTNAINVEGASKQMVATVLPEAANQNVLWSLYEVSGKATLSETGVLTAIKNGTVSVIARAMDIYGTVIDTQEVVLTNQIAEPSSISIVGTDSISIIDVNDGTLQMLINVIPDYANKSVTWSILEGDSDTATISNDGLLTALRNGVVTVIAVSNADETVSDTIDITISNQIVELLSLTVTGEGNATEITTDKGTLQMIVTGTPHDAVDATVNWSVAADDEALASISENGLLTAKANGTVTVIAESKANNTITAQKEIAISGQIVLVSGIELTAEGNATEISVKAGTLQLSANVTPADATDKSVNWESSDENIASVSQTGLVTALADGAVTIIAAATDASEMRDSLDLTISNQTVSIMTLNVTGINIYPNPVTDNLFIDNIENGSVVEIFNSLGQLILITEAYDKNHGINVRNLKPGSYILHSTKPDRAYRSVFIKK